jgi:allophanate hydrolase
MNESTLLTLADWRAAYDGGAAPEVMLERRLRRLRAESPSEVWIALVDQAGLESQLASLAARAGKHDDRAALYRALPLYGVPFAVKDNIDVAGLATTAACAAFRRVPEAHASVVARLVQAGAICLGKTNLDQFATGLVGARSPYGRPSSAFDAERISGGSSSGSAVAVARGDVPFALGTDTAGSGRVPAGFNNVVGLKPTPGRVGCTGVVPACRSLDCVSVLALLAADAAQVLAVIEGDDPRDAYSRFVAGPARLPARLRVGIPSHAVFMGDAGYGPAFESAVAHLRGLGHEVVPVDFAPLHAVADLLYDGPWVAERHAVVQDLLERDPDAFDPTVRTVIEAARDLSATDAFRGLYRLREAEQAIRLLWHGLDLLMVPTAPGHPRHAEVDAEPIGVNAQLGSYTNFVNLLGWCALAMPAGTASRGLPFGVTFIAPAACDAALARFGVEWQAGLALPLGATARPWPGGARPDIALDHGDGDPATPWPASAPTLPIVVVGAHLSGLPLNGQLTERGATLCRVTRTAPYYRLFALPGTVPPKPGMRRVAVTGASIEVEVWDLPMTAVGSFLALVPAPLGLGSIALVDGSVAHGFLCEPDALDGAEDVTSHGGWRAYLAHRRAFAETQRETATDASPSSFVPF